MKNVLIFGEGSYIGNAVQSWMQKQVGKYAVKTMSSIGISIPDTDFSSYQVIYCVAGIAHRKETEDNAHLYYEVNRDLICALAEKAKRDGVSHFILMSSLAVYGMNEGIIHKDTKERPTTHYGKSKLQADCMIQKLADDKFHVTILRVPMVYGAGCKGNYQRLRAFAMKAPIFPAINNQRSMIYIDNLCDYVEKVIREDITGIRFPQNYKYVCTSDMVNLIAKQHGKKIIFIKIPKCIIETIPILTVKKVFGNLICDIKEDRAGAVQDFADTIRLSEEMGES